MVQSVGMAVSCSASGMRGAVRVPRGVRVLAGRASVRAVPRGRPGAGAVVRAGGGDASDEVAALRAEVSDLKDQLAASARREAALTAELAAMEGGADALTECFVSREAMEGELKKELRKQMMSLSVSRDASDAALEAMRDENLRMAKAMDSLANAVTFLKAEVEALSEDAASTDESGFIHDVTEGTHGSS